MTSLERQLLNSRVPEIVIYLCASFHRCGINSLCTHSALVLQGYMNKLVWTAVIFNSIEATGPISNDRALKMYSQVVRINFWGGGQKGDLSKPTQTTPPCLLAWIPLIIYPCCLSTHCHAYWKYTPEFRHLPTADMQPRSLCCLHVLCCLPLYIALLSTLHTPLKASIVVHARVMLRSYPLCAG